MDAPAPSGLAAVAALLACPSSDTVDARGAGGYIARSPGGARRPDAQVAKW